MIRDIVRLLDHYGIDNQINQTIEELSELIQALTKYKRGLYTIDNISEEIADVEIMIKQIKLALSIDQEDVESIMIRKIERQLKRITDSRG